MEKITACLYANANATGEETTVLGVEGDLQEPVTSRGWSGLQEGWWPQVLVHLPGLAPHKSKCVI
jgi:hypothetical protein